MQNQSVKQQKEKARGKFDALPLPNFKHGLNIHSALDFVFSPDPKACAGAPWSIKKKSGTLESSDLSAAPDIAAFLEKRGYFDAQDKIAAWNLAQSRPIYFRFDGESSGEFDVDVSRERHDFVVFHVAPSACARMRVRFRGARSRGAALQTERIAVILEEGSRATVMFHADGVPPARVFSERRVFAARGAEFKGYDFCPNADSRFLRSEIDLEGEGSSARHTLLAGLTGEAVLDADVRIRHLAPNTESSLVMRAAGSGRSRAVFQGGIHIRPEAKNASGFQDIRGVTFDSAEIDPVPHLEIENADVKCGHAVTVSPFDEEAIFYLSSRGMEAHAARRSLLANFYASAFDGAAAPSRRDAERFIKKAVSSVVS